jgi:hypothetical protein
MEVELERPRHASIRLDAGFRMKEAKIRMLLNSDQGEVRDTEVGYHDHAALGVGQ